MGPGEGNNKKLIKTLKLIKNERVNLKAVLNDHY